MKALIKVELITDYMQEHNLSKSAFCHKCKISIGTLNKILLNNNVGHMKIKPYMKIALIINIKLSELIT